MAWYSIYLGLYPYSITLSFNLSADVDYVFIAGTSQLTVTRADIRCGFGTGLTAGCDFTAWEDDDDDEDKDEDEDEMKVEK